MRREIETIFAVIWVGGVGFLMYRYPEFFAKMSILFLPKVELSPGFISFTKKLGVVEMILAGIAAISGIIDALGWKIF